MASSVKVGDKAPDFTLPAQSGEPVRLQDRLGERVVVLYFYPKDNTPGCTAEACAFRAYEAEHRVRVRPTQRGRLVAGALRVPATRAGITARDLAVRVFGRPPAPAAA